MIARLLLTGAILTAIVDCATDATEPTRPAFATTGTTLVIACAGTACDTATVTVSAPPPTLAGGTGFGPSQMPTTTAIGFYTLRHEGVSASNLVSRLAAVRSEGGTLLTNMTGGDHSNYMTNGAFDLAKWEARMDTYNTSTIRQAVAQAVTDGVLVGNSVMDEPQVCGTGDGNTWGPCGTVTQAVVDQMCAYVKTIFPTLPVGVAHNHDAFTPSYRVCEFDITQYAARLGSVTAFRDGALSVGRQYGVRMVFSINVLNGGVQDKDGAWDCPQSHIGTYSPNCWMTPSEVRSYGLQLLPYGCAAKYWRWDATFVGIAANSDALRALADSVGRMPRRGCGR